MRIDQILPTMSGGDAIGNEVRAIQWLLLKSGHKSDIYAQNIAPGVRDVRKIHELRSNANALLIYHYSIGSTVTDLAIRQGYRLVLRFHNITPPDYYLGVNYELYKLLTKGYDDLAALEGQTELAICDSKYNARCLRKYGDFRTAVCPIVADPNKIARAKPDQKLLKRLDDGSKKFLFVGRFSLNKRHDKCIELFYHYQKANPESRLLLVGGHGGTEPYYAALVKFASNLGIADKVMFSKDKVTPEELAAYYRSADAFLCASEHEGFCVPLVESMACGVPVIAARQEAVAETLGKSPGLFEFDESDRTAVLAEKLRKAKGILEHQRKRFEEFGYPEKPQDEFIRLIIGESGRKQ